ncbi:MAG: phosphopyruvate hydratase [Nanoarchaeota archaeon]|nr:phosphopyruvate hydratase [Nanoarchaeota archaeon]
MPHIKKITAREILDSRGNPTVEVELSTKKHTVTASVPSGASTGKHEALELRDHQKRYHGQGVQKAIKNIKKIIFPKIKKINIYKQKEIDQLMINLDNTDNKSKLGANATLAVSLAVAKAAAKEKNLHLYQYLNQFIKRKKSLPRPFFNILNGGKHAQNKLAIQEFMIVPNTKSFQENLRIGSEVYHTLKKIINQKYHNTTVGDEGGFAPNLKNTEQALALIQLAIAKSGHSRKVDLALDCAASEFYNNNKYKIDGKKLTKEKLLKYYLKLIKKYPIISIEDPFHQDDFQSFAKLKQQTKIQIVGDDLTVTNITRIHQAIAENSCNCLLLKVNQIGTLTEAIAAAQLAYKNNWQVMVSHRSGETEDTFIADLAVGLGTNLIKAGAPARERNLKYNRLLRIEEILTKR